jgi:hypothetical protein
LSYSSAGFLLVGALVVAVPAGGFALLGDLDDDAVAAGDDVEVFGIQAVVNAGLGGEPSDLAPDWGKGLVAEERACGVAG